MSNESIMDSTEEAEVPLARQPLIRDPDIFTEFAEIEAKLEEKYGKKATADAIKFFAQEEEPRYELFEYGFNAGCIFRVLILFAVVLYLIFTILRTQGIVLWPLFHLGALSIIISIWFLYVTIYYGDTTDDTVHNYFLTEPGYSRSVLIVVFVSNFLRIFFVNDTDTPVYEIQMSSFFS